MYKLQIFPKARNSIKKLPKNHQRAIIVALREIRENPYLGKPLKEKLTGSRSFRVGVYRIIYRISKKDRIVKVSNAGHRSTIYKS